MKVLIADDHPLYRDALASVVRRAVVEVEITSCVDFSSAEASISAQDYDLALLDLHMPDGNGYYGLIHLRNQFPTIPVVIVSGSDDPRVIQKCMGFGASGFIPKTLPTEAMIEALLMILQGEIWLPEQVKDEIQKIDAEDKQFANKVAQLTEQQYRVLCELNEGRLNKQIAYDLDITEATVKAHMTAIFRKLGVNNRTQAVIAAQRLQLQPDINQHSESN